MGVTVQLDALTEIDSLSMQVYRYQDAWIFLPDSVRFQWSVDGENWNGGWWTQPFGTSTFDPNDAQDVQRLAFPVGEAARWVRFEARNPVHAPNGTMPPAQRRGYSWMNWWCTASLTLARLSPHGQHAE